MPYNECYIPGKFNINKSERQRRLRNGWLYLVITISFFLFSFLFNLPQIFKVLVYIPATLSALGFVQYYYSFCVYYGLKKIDKTTEDVKIVKDDEDNEADKKTSINILVVSLSIGFLVTILLFLLT